MVLLLLLHTLMYPPPTELITLYIVYKVFSVLFLLRIIFPQNPCWTSGINAWQQGRWYSGINAWQRILTSLV